MSPVDTVAAKHKRAIEQLVSTKSFAEVLTYSARYASVLHPASITLVFKRAQVVPFGANAVTATEYEDLIALCVGVRASLYRLNPDGLTDVILGLAAQGVRPPVAFSQRWAELVANRFDSFSGAAMVQIICAMHKLQLGPNDLGIVFFERFTHHMTPLLHSRNAVQLHDLIVAIADIVADSHVTMEADFFVAFCSACKAVLRPLNKAAVSAALVSLGWEDVAFLRERERMDPSVPVDALLAGTNPANVGQVANFVFHLAQRPFSDGREEIKALAKLCEQLTLHPATLNEMTADELTTVLDVLRRYLCGKLLPAFVQ